MSLNEDRAIVSVNDNVTGFSAKIDEQTIYNAGFKDGYALAEREILERLTAQQAKENRP